MSDTPVKPNRGESELATGMRIPTVACVDHVLIFDEDTPERLLEHVRPDLLVKGGTTRKRERGIPAAVRVGPQRERAGGCAPASNSR